MPFTPADVANVAFSKPPIGKRGYNEDEVDAFLDLLETELARLIKENNDLRYQVEHLEQRQRAAPVPTRPDVVPVEPPGPVMAPVLLPSMVQQASSGGDHNVHAARVLGLAQVTVDQLTGEAKAEADAMVGEARAKAEQLLSDARVMADGLVNEARARAETMLICGGGERQTRGGPFSIFFFDLLRWCWGAPSSVLGSRLERSSTAQRPSGP